MKISNISYERTIISTLLFDSRNVHLIQEFISPNDFVDPVSKECFEIIETKVAVGHSINETILMSEIKNKYKEIIANEIVSIAPVDTKTLIDMSKEIEELSIRRKTIDILNNAIRDIKNGKPYDLSELSNLEKNTSFFRTNEEILAIMEDRILNKKVSAATGIDELDRFLVTSPGDAIVIAARPSMGKTSFVTTLMLNFAKQNEGSLFLSLEMPADSIMARFISAISSEPVSNIKRNKITNFEEYKKAVSYMKNTELIEIVDASMDENDIVHYVKKRIKSNPKIKHVFLDHLTYVKNNRNYQNEHQRLGSITRTFKNLAKDVGIRFWELSQLSRNVENRPNRRPQLSDLRESGAIEENADIVMGIYNESYYKAREKGEMQPPISKVELSVLKFRDGPVGTARAIFNSPCVRFEPYDEALLEEQKDAIEDEPVDVDEFNFPANISMPEI